MHSSRAAALLLALSTAWTLPSAAQAPASTPQVASRGTCPAIPLAGATASAVRVPSAADAWGGPRNGTEATLSNRVVSYRSMPS